jgi:hypothetical protein
VISGAIVGLGRWGQTEAFADAVAATAPYPISEAAILNVTTAFIAIIESIRSGGSARPV